MLKRTIVGLALIAFLLIVVLVLPKFLTAVVGGLFCAVMAYELLGTTKLVRNPRMIFYSVLAGFFVSLWSYFGCPAAAGILGLLIFYAVLFSELMLSNVKIPFSKLALCMMAGAVVPCMFSSLIRILVMPEGRAYILIPFVVGCLSDVGGYFVGSMLGKHKLCPEISPKKTVEGLAGGVAASVLGLLLYCLILMCFGFRVHILLVLLYGVVGSLAAVFGDLTFSVVKRQTNIKDYGNIFPGHGGVLDRVDSIVVVAPLMEALLLLFPVVTR